MKKHLLFLLGALLALPTLARDFQYTYEGQTINYTVINEEAKTCKTKEGEVLSPPFRITEATAGNTVSGKLILPSNPKDGNIEFTLIEISTCAFWGCSGLTSVTIPNSVTFISACAFGNCSSLETVYFNAENCRQCGYYVNPAFPSTIKKLFIGDSVKQIPSYAFYECSGLTSVTIPNSVTSIGEEAFMDCSGLTSVTIPNSVTSFGVSAFQGCRGLTSVTIPNSLTSIGWSAFEDCSGLTSVCIPNSITSIGEDAFQGCSGLTSITIPNSVTSIGEDAFAECTSLTSITIPNSVTSIGEEAFAECTSLTSLTIGNSVKSIGFFAFYGCSSLTSVTIPNSVTEILASFANCENLSAINVDPSNTSFSSVNGVLYSKDLSIIVLFPAGKKQQSFSIPNSVTEIGNRSFVYCNNLTSINIPNSVTQISNLAFYGCSSLTSVTIPNSVTRIEDDAFRKCSGLTSVTYLAEEPLKSYQSIFSDDTYQKATLNYLKSAEEKIASTSPWSHFINRIGRDADYKEEGAISEVQATDGAATTVYDMRGVKVGTSTSGLQRGIYIANGRKIFVR